MEQPRNAADSTSVDDLIYVKLTREAFMIHFKTNQFNKRQTTRDGTDRRIKEINT